jgi:hypothetical protein
MTKKEAQDLKGILTECPQTPKIQLALAIVEKQIKYFESLKGQLKEQWDSDTRAAERSWW